MGGNLSCGLTLRTGPAGMELKVDVVRSVPQPLSGGSAPPGPPRG